MGFPSKGPVVSEQRQQHHPDAEGYVWDDSVRHVLGAAGLDSANAVEAVGAYISARKSQGLPIDFKDERPIPVLAALIELTPRVRDDALVEAIELIEGAPDIGAALTSLRDYRQRAWRRAKADF